MYMNAMHKFTNERWRRSGISSLLREWAWWFHIQIALPGLSWYYRVRYGLKLRGPEGSIVPHTGQNNYSRVVVAGKIIRIFSADGTGEVRIVPYVPNCGVMIERYGSARDGEFMTTAHLDYETLASSDIHSNKIEKHWIKREAWRAEQEKRSGG